MGGALLNRSSTAAEHVKPIVNSDDNDRWIMGDLIFKLENNSVSSSSGSLKIYWVKDY